MKQRSKITTNRVRISLAIGIILILVVIGVVIAYRTTRHVSKIIPSTSPTTTQVNNSIDNGKTPSIGGSSDNTQNQTTPTSPSPAPSQPFGNFVSSHSPSLSQSPQMASVCNTTVGASCWIEFSKDTTVLSLKAVTTDNSGTAYWYWNLNDDGFSTGSWQITAKATLKGQTVTVKDTQPLVVKP
jgi:cytoskeletal protein RodZ